MAVKSQNFSPSVSLSPMRQLFLERRNLLSIALLLKIEPLQCAILPLTVAKTLLSESLKGSTIPPLRSAAPPLARFLISRRTAPLRLPARYVMPRSIAGHALGL